MASRVGATSRTRRWFFRAEGGAERFSPCSFSAFIFLLKWGGDPRSFPGCTTHPFYYLFVVGYPPFSFVLPLVASLSVFLLTYPRIAHTATHIRNKSTTTNLKIFTSPFSTERTSYSEANNFSSAAVREPRRVDFNSPATVPMALSTRRWFLSLYAVQKDTFPTAIASTMGAAG